MVPTAARTSEAAPSRAPLRELAGASLVASARSIKRRTSPRFTLRVDVRGSGASKTKTTAAPVRDAEYRELLNVLQLAEARFDVVGVDVLATGGDHDVFGAAHDRELPFAIDLSEVARAQPAAADDGAGRFFVARVAEHHVRTARQDLAHALCVGGVDLQFYAGNCAAHVTGFGLRTAGRDAQHGRRFGQTVALG